jgi:hypothetical protein
MPDPWAGLWLPKTSLQFLEYHPSSDGDILELYIFPPRASLNWAPRELVRLIPRMGHHMLITRFQLCLLFSRIRPVFGFSWMIASFRIWLEDWSKCLFPIYHASSDAYLIETVSLLLEKMVIESIWFDGSI